MTTIPKPPKSTPASRRVERQKRERNTLKTYAEKKPPKLLGRGKPGVKRLDRNRKIGGHIIKGVSQRTGLKAGTKLKVVGRRGKRLAPGDRKAAASIKGLGCLCGCNLPPQWAHLQTRAVESTRHDPTYSIPACDYLHNWLDQGKGTAVRPQLFDMAAELQRRLTHEDIFRTLKDAGYYTWLVDKRTII